MINSINYSIFPSDELYTFGSGVASHVNNKITSLPALSTRANFLNMQLGFFQKALMRTTKNPYTQQLATADEALDRSFKAMCTYFEAASQREIKSWRQAAIALIDVTDRYGRTSYKLGYKAQIATQSNLAKEIKEKHMAQLSAIAGDDWFAAFDGNLSSFIALFNKSTEEAHTDQPTLQVSRPQLTDALRKLFNRINVLAEDEPSDEVNALINSLNELIVRSLSTAKASATREQRQRDEESVN